MAATSSSALYTVQSDLYQRPVITPKYKMLRVPMNNSSLGTVSVSATGSAPIEFKLPSTKVYNLSRSYISYQQSIPAAANPLEANWMYQDMFSLGNAITFGSAGGNDLVNLQYANNYSKIARKIHTPADQLLSNGNLSGLYRYNGAASDNYVPGGNKISNILARGDFAANDNYTEARYSSRLGVNLPLSEFRQYPLGAFHGTLLGIDRDFYAPVEQYLRITCGPGSKVGFTTTSVASPPVLTGNCQNLGVDVTFSNIYLYLAVEQNDLIIATMMDDYAKGKLKFAIPYTTGFKTQGASAGMQTNINVTLTRQYGKRLKRITHSVFNGTENLNTAYDHDNGNGLKIQSYQTFLDNTPLQDRVLSCLAAGRDIAGAVSNTIGSDDWTENSRFLGKDSSILSKEQYSLNWFHRDQFFEDTELSGGGTMPEVNMDIGLRMESDMQWLFSGVSTSSAQIHYTWAEFTREVLMGADGAIFV